MAKVLGLRQQRVQFFYDTDFKTQGVTLSSSRDFCVPEKILFATASGQGDLSRTNIVTPGQLSSDQTFLTFAVRHELNFFSANSNVTTDTAAYSLKSVAELSFPFRHEVEQLVNKRQRWLQSLEREPKRYVIWGAAAKGSVLIDAMRQYGVVVDGVVDSNASKWGRYLESAGIQAMSPTEFLKSDTRKIELLVANPNHLDEVRAYCSAIDIDVQSPIV